MVLGLVQDRNRPTKPSRSYYNCYSRIRMIINNNDLLLNSLSFPSDFCPSVLDSVCGVSDCTTSDLQSRSFPDAMKETGSIVHKYLCRLECSVGARLRCVYYFILCDLQK